MKTHEQARLRAQLLDPRTSEECSCQLALRYHEEGDPDVLALLTMTAVDSTEIDARVHALQALGTLGGTAPEALDPVLHSLSPHEDDRVLSAAIVAAIRMNRAIGDRRDQVQQRLEELIERPEDDLRGLVRSAAARILGEHDPIALSGPRPKVLDLGSAPIDDPIYTGGWTIFTPQRPASASEGDPG